jgi:NAD(P)-dependent dehydrogenase (short-subunit alcohol dehydrogenase family)
MPFLEKSQDPRIINVSSDMHKTGDIDFKDIDSKNEAFWSFRTYKAYGTSKLANILHAKELTNRYSGKLKAV